MIDDAAIIVPYQGGKILLQLRDEFTKNRPNMWSFFGGAIKNGESPLEAIARELFEELNVSDINPVMYKIIPRIKKSGSFTKYLFVAETNFKIDFFKKNLKEGKDVMFFEEPELCKLHMKESDIRIATDVFSYLMALKHQ